MSKYGKRILAAGMCASMAMGLLTGCSSSNDEVVAKMGDTKLTLGEANFMLRYSQAQTQSYLGAMFGEGTNVFQQDLTGSGQAYGETVKESVLNDLKDMTILEQHMSDYNVELTDEDKAAIEEAAKQFIADNSKDVLKEMSATEETVSRILTLYTIQSKMETAIEADVDTEVSDEEAAQKTIQYAYFTIPETESETEDATEATSADESASETETGTEAVSETETETEATSESETVAETETEATSETEAASEAASEETSEDITESETEESAEKKETRETVQGIIDAVQGGETLEDAVKAADESKSLTSYSYGADEETLNENLKNAADALSDGEIASEPVEGENGFYVVQMVSTFDRDATDQKKEEIIKDRKKELYDNKIAEWDTESFDINEKVWDKVTFEEIFTLKQEETESETGTESASEASTDTEGISEAESVSETEGVTEAASETESVAEETESEIQSEAE
ncbi:peptidyl-prolyl cis-trans isomerase [Lachnospiraceae bacterium OF09-6]|nr:peptidyl-prolyl cis-trans isomerase [Lachnospiraceae bacterium OF09-6]